MPKGKVGFVRGDPNAGAPVGNNNSIKSKPWRDALNRAIAQQDGKKLRAMADKLIAQAMKGDVSALKEIGDRLDGKAIQQVEAKVEGRIIITKEDENL